MNRQTDTAFFRASFFRPLPKEIQVLLADEVNGNLKELAIRADELYTHHRSTAVAAIHQGDMWEDTASLEEAVAALNIKGGRDSFRPKRQEKPGNNAAAGGGTSSGGGGGGSGGKSYFICNCHWKYGEKAYKCDLPKKCQWQGN